MVMKKIFTFLIVIVLFHNVKGQFVCGFDEIPSELSRYNCIRNKPADDNDTLLFMQRFIPNDTTPIITIKANINIWRNDDGTGSWWQENQAYRDSMHAVFDYLNYIYANNIPLSDPITGAVFILDTKVRFEIDTFYYYDNSTLAYCSTISPFTTYLQQNHPERLQKFNIHLSLESELVYTGVSSGLNSEYQSIVCLRQGIHNQLWGEAVLLAHEFGHNFGLGHPYDSEQRDITNREFLWDLFGTTQQPWCTDSNPLLVCYHDHGWDCNPSDPNTTCTNNIMGGTFQARNFTALQCGRIHRALSIAPIRKYATGYSHIPYEITHSQTWDFTRKMYQDIVIDSLATLTITCTLEMVDSARIIVRPGGKLIVNGGTLTNACDGEMWQGIIVEGNANIRQTALAQGSVILNNATIENAHNAISTRNANNTNNDGHTGGIIQATNTLFRNNCRSVEFLKYENHTTGGAVTDNVSYFTRCTFTVDNDNLFAQNGTSFNSHVTMWHVRGVKFNGCTFRNETSNHSGKAVYTEEAGFTAKRVCPSASGPQDPCYCVGTATDTVTRCSFTSFDTAVHVAGTNGSYAVTLDNCDFSDNHVGIFLAAADNARVSFCDFDLDYMSSASTGVYLKNSTGYTVESNSFHRTYYSALNSVGVCTDNSGTAENVIRLNDFAKLTHGCYAWNCNAETISRPATGLQYACNDFDSCLYSIYVGTAAKIRTVQGSPSVGADNSFYNNSSNSRSLTIPTDHVSVKYYYHNSGSHAPVGSSNYTPCQAANANSCVSSLCGALRCQGDGLTALEQYLSMAEEYATIVETVRDVETCHGASLQTDAPDPQDETDATDLIGRLSDLSAQMGDLARAEIRNILNDSVPDMALLKRWYATIVETLRATSLPMADSIIPVAAYQLAETYSMEGDLAAAAALLSSLPQQFTPDEAARNEYANYMALQQLRETVAGNWYTMTDSDIAAMQQVAEYDNGRAARMAKEILCFFHHICYEDEPMLELDGIGERALRGDGACPIAATDDGLRLHPNPTTHTLTVETTNPIRTLTVYDLAGRVMMTVDGGANDYSPLRIMDVSSLPNGIYLLRAVTDNGVETGRFVKN